MPSPLDDRLAPVSKLAKDALYVSVGLGVLAARELNTRRLALASKLDTQVDGGKQQATKLMSEVETQLKALDERVDAIEARLDSVLDQFQATLPEQAREVVQQARDAAKSARQQVRQLIRVA